MISPRSDATIIEADPHQLDQVVMNLAVNARDAMPRGGKFVLETAEVDLTMNSRSETSGLSAGKYVMLAVSDTGSGMTPEVIARIFEPFFTTKELGKGTGLGLATVYGIVKQNGGHILVYSEPGHGTTFKIYLPSAEHKLDLPSHEAVQAADVPRRGNTILLVEDDEIMRSLTRQLLEQHGYTVFEANDGRIGTLADGVQTSNPSICF